MGSKPVKWLGKTVASSCLPLPRDLESLKAMCGCGVVASAVMKAFD